MRRTVLLVEDHPDTRELYALVLGGEGYDVLEASDGAQALALLEHRQVDIVVTDLAMPGVDGVELCRRIRAVPEARGVPILAVTGQANDAALANIAAGGACAVCPKPVSPPDLALAVRALLAEGSRCYFCWQTPEAFKVVRFGTARGWMRHEPLTPEE
jgi:two-component system, chemotaxis family, chemotaxis protein CheY